MVVECVISLVLSHHNKNLKRRTSATALRQISVTAQCYLQNKRKIHPWGMRACWPKTREEGREREREQEREQESETAREAEKTRQTERERESESPRPLFLCFSLPLALPSVSWASQECCLFSLRSSLWPLNLPLFYFPELFPSLSFSHHHSGFLFPVLAA